jgi:UDP-glucose 4,6-dehydratase
MITLLGHGYIGNQIASELLNQKIPYRWLRHSDDLITSDTTAIINSAGFTGSPNVDACEVYRQETIDGNVRYPLWVENKAHRIPVVHISSGCVYTGYKEDGWTEEDEPNFDFNNGSFYSGSKALAQELLTPYLMTKSYLLRIRMPFGNEPNSKNFLTKLERYERLIDYQNSLSYTIDVARVAVHFAVNKPEPGIYNVCNPGSSTTRRIADQMGLNKSWFTEEEFKQATRAPRSNCVLNTDKLQKVFPIQSVESALKTAITQYKQND